MSVAFPHLCVHDFFLLDFVWEGEGGYPCKFAGPALMSCQVFAAHSCFSTYMLIKHYLGTDLRVAPEVVEHNWQPIG